ncbi:diguanylate cyclase [Xylanibacillus composti]|uniref:GGDEF domain-containing protein n=1 Tax=Xylanibacillus composti TaxID=1572762 RepID=A0A8J4H3C5_9BACL|nr:diguanylate cyclase [Xylanibacillus composti]MDT9724163.1 diguanylate cyclase [Xylanibacillus composti]GIQ68712.1 hypothetical protein XYCOK13_15360 [Xylanibacillus composti]
MQDYLGRGFMQWLEQLHMYGMAFNGIAILTDADHRPVAWGPKDAIAMFLRPDASEREEINRLLASIREDQGKNEHVYVTDLILSDQARIGRLYVQIVPNSPIKLPKEAWTAMLACSVEAARREKLEWEEGFARLRKQDVLFRAVQKLHATIDVDAVLQEVYDNMKEVYPASEIDIYLSQDYHSNAYFIKPLTFGPFLDDANTRAFMEGKIQLEEQGKRVKWLSVPLAGKQGIYGVLQIVAKQEWLDDSDVRFIALLADSAGSAFENAKLYEQSNLLISELRLINEITRRLNQSLKLNEIFNFASHELIDIFKADSVCILQVDPEQRTMIVKASNETKLINEHFPPDYGFAGSVTSTKEPLIVSDYRHDPRKPSRFMDLTGARSLMASPIIASSEVIGVVLVAHREPNYFSYDNFKLLQVLSGHIGLAMVNASLHAEVRRMVITDRLTGLYARHYLDEQINFMQKKDFCGSLIVVDIDHFKQINDTYGHQVGDKILIQVSQIIRSCIRDSDIAARWGGEEIAIYLPQAKMHQAAQVADRIRSRVYEETDPKVSISCGLSEWNWEDEKVSVESLFYRADMALYEAKHAGRNQIKLG